ncbi:MAG: sugar transferase [Gemmatimonadota bacterium]|nr:sugar transferase [Gemmatimonadota bacterium]
MVKRLFDLLVSCGLLLLFAPLILLVAVYIRILHGSPVLFRQRRPGYLGEPFVLYKFRTMLDVRDDKEEIPPDSERLTAFGRFLRSTSIDELPEMINVLKGDMSLVGPRPLLLKYLERYSPEQIRRHDLKPGITGWAQVNGRNEVTWEQKFEMDLWYIDHQTFYLDIKILCLTFWKSLRREGITQTGHATAEEFMGST